MLLLPLRVSPTRQDVAARAPADNPAVALLYARWLGGRPGSAAARRLLHTSYRERETTGSGMADLTFTVCRQ